jgi:transcription elongation factor GreA
METLAEIRHLREEQASEPLDLAHTFKQLQQIENEMARIDAVLMHANICQQGERDVACIGAKVTLASAGQQLVIVLVDSIEANPLDGYISVESPLGKEVVGKRPRTQLQVQTIKGLCVYEILAIN